MKRKIVIIGVVVQCLSAISYTMWRPRVSSPTNFNFTSGSATAPKFEKIDPVPKAIEGTKPTINVALNAVAAEGAQSSSVFGSLIALPQAKVSPVVEGKVLSESAAKSKAVDLVMPVERVDVAQAVAAEQQSSADLNLVQDAAAVHVKPAAKTSFLDAIKGRKVGESKSSLSQQDVSQAVTKGALKFETLDQYQKALYDVEVQAEQQALKPINRKASELFQQQWQSILNKYTTDRAALGQTVLPERVELLKNQTKNKISQDLMIQSKDAIAQAVQKAVEDFRARAVKPERVVRSSQSKILGKSFAPAVTEVSVRSQAENQMRDSIIKPMVDAKFTPEFESVWLQDYALDYEMKHNAQASVKNIDAAKKEYVDKLRLDAYKELTSGHKTAIKQAGTDAVAQWKLQKESQAEQVAVSVQPVVVPVSKLGPLDQIKAGVLLKPVEAPVVKGISVEGGRKAERPSSPTTVADFGSRSASPVLFE